MKEIKLSEFLEIIPTPLHHNQPKSPKHPWVFWSKNEGSENNSSSSDSHVGTPLSIIHDRIKSVFSDLNHLIFIGQFWAHVTINGKKLLSTSGQPFAVSHLSNEFAMYRLDCDEYEFDIDVNKLDDIEEGDHPKIRSGGGPATVFLNRLSYMGRLLKSESCFGLKFCTMLPICIHSQSNDCIGVLEITFIDGYEVDLVLDAIKALKKAGLDVCNLQDLIPYKTINGLTPAKDEITHALKVVCKLHSLSRAQVWIATKDKRHVPLSSDSKDTLRILGIKLTSYLHAKCHPVDLNSFENHHSLCDVFPLKIRKEPVLNTLQDFQARYISSFRPNFLIHWKLLVKKYCAFAICLRSIDTGDFNFAFEFIWVRHSRRDTMLEEILLTLKGCLPGFKFASGAELGDELGVIDVKSVTDNNGYEIDDTKMFKLFQGKRSSPILKAPQEGKNLVVVDYMASSEVMCKTTAKVLPREVTERQFEKTMREAAKNVKDSQTRNIKIFKGKILSPVPKALEEGKQPIVVDNIAPREVLPSEDIDKQLDVICVESPMEKTKVKHKTSEIFLTREVIEKESGKTMKEAAKNLNVSLSTLKRKCKVLGISEWQGRVKRRANDSCSIQKSTNEANGAIHDPSIVNISNNIVFIKAEYEDDMIRFDRPISQATFVTVEKIIGMKFKLSVGTFKLKYQDEDKDWILLTSDEEMSHCVNSSRKSDRIVVRLRVHASERAQAGN